MNRAAAYAWTGLILAALGAALTIVIRSGAGDVAQLVFLRGLALIAVLPVVALAFAERLRPERPRVANLAAALAVVALVLLVLGVAGIQVQGMFEFGALAIAVTVLGAPEARRAPAWACLAVALGIDLAERLLFANASFDPALLNIGLAMVWGGVAAAALVCAAPTPRAPATTAALAGAFAAATMPLARDASSPTLRDLYAAYGLALCALVGAGAWAALPRSSLS